MAGQRVATTPSADALFDVYATHDGTPSSVKVLAGVWLLVKDRSYGHTITGLSSVGITGNSVKIRTRRFGGPNLQTPICAPIDLCVWEHAINNDQVNIPFLFQATIPWIVFNAMATNRLLATNPHKTRFTFWVQPEARLQRATPLRSRLRYVVSPALGLNTVDAGDVKLDNTVEEPTFNAKVIPIVIYAPQRDFQSILILPVTLIF